MENRAARAITVGASNRLRMSDMAPASPASHEIVDLAELHRCSKYLRRRLGELCQ
jgi:hypothetical protein